MAKPPGYPLVRPLVMLLAMLVGHASATVALSLAMGVSNKIPDGLDEVDVVIAGGRAENLIRPVLRLAS
jgi:hypothetical protein